MLFGAGFAGHAWPENEKSKEEPNFSLCFRATRARFGAHREWNPPEARSLLKNNNIFKDIVVFQDLVVRIRVSGWEGGNPQFERRLDPLEMKLRRSFAHLFERVDETERDGVQLIRRIPD